MPNPTFPFMWYDNELWDLPENWLGLFWLNSILFFLWQNVQPQTTLSPHPSSALMIFTSTFILPAGTCHNSTIKNKNNPEVKKKIAYNKQYHTDSPTICCDITAEKKIRRFSFSYWANTAPHKEPFCVFCPVAYLCIPCPNQESARDINKNWVDPSVRNALEDTQ